MVDFVTKPIDPYEVFEALVKWIKVKERNIDELKDIPKQDKEIEQLIIPNFEIIDTSKGLMRINNNKKLYFKLLDSFYTKYSDFETNIKSLINDKKIQVAEREAHTLKGVAGNIGMDRVSEEAAKLELKLKQNDIIGVNELISKLSSVLSMTLKELEALEFKTLENLEEESEFTEFDKLTKLLDELVYLIEEDDFAVKDKFEEIMKLKAIQKFSSELKKIENKVLNYDYDVAIKLVKQFRKNIETK